MPLTSRSKVYKQLPQYLADSVFQACSNVKIKEIWLEEQRKDNLKKKHEPSSDTCSSSEEPSTTKRQRTPQSDVSNSSVPSTPMSVGCEENEANPLSLQPVRPPSAMDTDSRNSSPPSPILRPKLNRCDSRTTTSLDNVEMWESDSELELIESHPSKFDRINGVLINPRKTYDLSELRRARTTTATRLMQTLPPSRSPSSTPSPRCQNAPRPATPKKRRPPKLSLPKVPMSGDPCVAPTDRIKSKPEGWVKPQNESAQMRVSKLNTVSTNAQCKAKQSNPNNKSLFDSYLKDSLPGGRLNSPSYLKNPAGGTLSLAITQRKLPSDKMAAKSNLSQTTQPQQTYDSKSDSKSDRRPSVEGRRVKFNSLVTVTDGEKRSTDILRSSKNSGQLIKQKFLGSDFSRTQSSNGRNETSKDYWEMVC